MKPAALLVTLLAAQSLGGAPSISEPVRGSELRFCLHSEPKTFNPLMASEDSDEAIRYMTAGVLIRINRLTQVFEPEIAESWRILDSGRKIEFKLREGVRFSDGTPLTPADVRFTLRAIFDPTTHSPAGDPFQIGKQQPTVTELSGRRILVSFPAPMAGVERLFDQIAVVSQRSLELSNRPGEMPSLGSFHVAEYRPGSYVLLVRNPYYWKKDTAGRQLPYLDSVRLLIQQNRDLELMHFLRGETHMIDSMNAELFERLSAKRPDEAHDAGRSLESEQMWFNQVAGAPIPEYRKEWFHSREFRQAISKAINRADLARMVYWNRAVPSIGPISPANLFWFNGNLPAPACDPKAALKLLQTAGFSFSGSKLSDRQGNRVEFSLITNSGNKSREQIAAMIQQDLDRVGIRLNVVTLDFTSLIERISRTFNYESCLLGLVNVDLDPNAQTNIWLSSATNHPWNPSQAAPETEWEAEIDHLIQAQATEVSPRQRKALFDRVQKIVVKESPVLYLVDKNSLSAVSSLLGNASPAMLHPQTFWNIERLYLRKRPEAPGQ